MFKQFRYAQSFGKELLKLGCNPKELPPTANRIFQEYINFSRDRGISAQRAAELFHGYMQEDKTAIECLKTILPIGLKYALLGEEGLGEEFIGKKVEGDLLDHIISLYPDENKDEAIQFLEMVRSSRKDIPKEILAAIFFFWTSDRHNARVLILRLPDLKTAQIEVHKILESSNPSNQEVFSSIVKDLRSSGNWPN